MRDSGLWHDEMRAEMLKDPKFANEYAKLKLLLDKQLDAKATANKMSKIKIGIFKAQ